MTPDERERLLDSIRESSDTLTELARRYDRLRLCETCGGMGKCINDFGSEVTCPDCAGTGVEELPRMLDDDVI